jgi:hypothetical protein
MSKTEETPAVEVKESVSAEETEKVAKASKVKLDAGMQVNPNTGQVLPGKYALPNGIIREDK